MDNPILILSTCMGKSISRQGKHSKTSNTSKLQKALDEQCKPRSDCF